MRPIKALYITLCVALLTLAACREKYVPTLNSSGKGVLVVEGFIAVGPQVQTKIILSRATDLTTTAINYETKAKLNIQAETGTIYPLTEISSGNYISAPLTLTPGSKYRLQITTASGKEYLSDYEAGLTTPLIDSISYAKTSDGSLQVYTNSTISPTQARYYDWKTEETWEFHSQYPSYLKFTFDNTGAINGVRSFVSNTITVDNSIYTCWKSENSTKLLLENLDRFSTDKIKQPLVLIPPNSVKLSVLYSVNIIQHALSRNAYLFLETMKRNTEQLGTTFDPQPSYLQGNVHATSDPAELVIGYVGATQETTRRVFIDPAKIPGGWPYQSGCTQVVAHNDPVELRGYLLYYPIGYTSLVKLDSVILSRDTCVNCLTRGGNIKPSFWP
jgi:hypothetical protein